MKKKLAYSIAAVALILLAIIYVTPTRVKNRVNSLGMDMIWCPPGSFFYGGESTQIELKGFWMGSCEVTNLQWSKVMGSDGRDNALRVNAYGSFAIEKMSETAPITAISYSEAKAFCRLLTALEHLDGSLEEGLSYRLPNVEEWNYAYCEGRHWRDLNHDPKVLGWGEFLESDEIEKDGRAPRFVPLHPVAGKSANGWGLFDMVGNAEEFCSPGIWMTDASKQGYEDVPIVRGGSVYGIPSSHEHIVGSIKTNGKFSIETGFRIVLAKSEND